MLTVSPNIYVHNLPQTIAYYHQLGFQVVARFPEEGDAVFAMMKNGEVTFLFQTFESLGNELPDVKRTDGGSLMLYVQMKGIRDFYEKIKDKVTVLKGLEVTFYGATEFTILDCNNYVLCFAEDE
jgi:uncharacterized glyoxalase superfamily protein PhnB